MSHILSTLEKKVVEITATFDLKTNYSHSRSLEHQLAMAKAKLGDKRSPSSSLSKSCGSVHSPGVDTRFWID